MHTIDCTAGDVVAGDVVSADGGLLVFAVSRVTRFRDLPPLLTLWNADGKAAIFFSDDPVVVVRNEVADEGHECPECRSRFRTEDEAEDCLVAHAEERGT